MDQWLAYLLKEEEEKKAFAQKYIEEEAAFRAELALLGDAVKWYNSNQGIIIRNNLIFEFTLNECHIHKRVRIEKADGLGLSDFLLMSDNKYLPADK